MSLQTQAPPFNKQNWLVATTSFIHKIRHPTRNFGINVKEAAESFDPNFLDQARFLKLVFVHLSKLEFKKDFAKSKPRLSVDTLFMPSERQLKLKATCQKIDNKELGDIIFNDKPIDPKYKHNDFIVDFNQYIAQRPLERSDYAELQRWVRFLCIDSFPAEKEACSYLLWKNLPKQAFSLALEISDAEEKHLALKEILRNTKQSINFSSYPTQQQDSLYAATASLLFEVNDCEALRALFYTLSPPLKFKVVSYLILEMHSVKKLPLLREFADSLVSPTQIFEAYQLMLNQLIEVKANEVVENIGSDLFKKACSLFSSSNNQKSLRAFNKAALNYFLRLMSNDQHSKIESFTRAFPGIFNDALFSLAKLLLVQDFTIPNLTHEKLKLVLPLLSWTDTLHTLSESLKMAQPPFETPFVIALFTSAHIKQAELTIEEFELLFNVFRPFYQKIKELPEKEKQQLMPKLTECIGQDNFDIICELDNASEG